MFTLSDLVHLVIAAFGLVGLVLAVVGFVRWMRRKRTHFPTMFLIGALMVPGPAHFVFTDLIQQEVVIWCLCRCHETTPAIDIPMMHVRRPPYGPGYYRFWVWHDAAWVLRKTQEVHPNAEMRGSDIVVDRGVDRMVIKDQGGGRFLLKPECD